jgi:hypothetical protein
VSPLDPGLVQLISAGAQLLSAGLSLAAKLGQRDAFLDAMDAGLAVMRQRTDVDLARKHRKASDDHPGSTGEP